MNQIRPLIGQMVIYFGQLLLNLVDCCDIVCVLFGLSVLRYEFDLGQELLEFEFILAKIVREYFDIVESFEV